MQDLTPNKSIQARMNDFNIFVENLVTQQASLTWFIDAAFADLEALVEQKNNNQYWRQEMLFIVSCSVDISHATNSMKTMVDNT